MRIDRGALVDLAYLAEVHAGFGGRLPIRVEDGQRPSSPVGRDHVDALENRQGLCPHIFVLRED